MLDKQKAIKICKQIGNIFENHKLTNGDVIEFITLYLTLMNKFVEEE